MQVEVKAAQVISLTLLSVLSAGDQLIKLGKCSKPDAQATVDATRVNMKTFASISVEKKHIGKWHEIQTLAKAFQKGQCGTAAHTAKSPSVIGVLNRELL